MLLKPCEGIPCEFSKHKLLNKFYRSGVKGGGYCPGGGYPSGSGKRLAGIAVEVTGGSGVIVAAVTAIKG